MIEHVDFWCEPPKVAPRSLGLDAERVVGAQESVDALLQRPQFTWAEVATVAVDHDIILQQ